MDSLVIHIDMDKKCTQCRKPGAMENGRCMACVTKNLKAGKYDHLFRPLAEKANRALKASTGILPLDAPPLHEDL